MVFHILVYFYSDGYINNDYFVHIFDNIFRGYQYYINFANSLLSEHCPDCYLDFRYVGYEKLPLSNVGEGWFLFKGGDNVKLIESDGNTNLEKISEFRKNKITIDYDHDDVYDFVFNFFSKKPDVIDVKFVKFFKTKRGCHMRATLCSSLDFEKKLELRRMLFDDSDRIYYDIKLYDCGFEGLTELLFNGKYFVNDDNGCAEYSEEPLMLNSFKISINLPEIKCNTFNIKGNTVTLKEPFTPEKAYQLFKKIEDNLCEYKSYLDMKSNLKNKIVNAYREINPLLAITLEVCSFSIEKDCVVIHVPQKLSCLIGRMIGKQGINVKKVEHKTGVKIKISQGEPSDETKTKLQKILQSIC